MRIGTLVALIPELKVIVLQTLSFFLITVVPTAVPCF